MRRLISSRQPAVDPAAFRQRILLRQANEKAVDPVRTRRRRRSAPPECRPAVNPATGETLKTYGDITDEEAERCLAAAHASYRLTDFGTRAGWMRRAADILDGECDQVAAMMTAEMGKTFAAARQEVGKCAAACRFYADRAAGFLADEPADAVGVGPSRPTSGTSHSAGPGDHAVEFPALAGHALCRPRPDARQRGAAQACIERAADGYVHAGPVQPGGLPRGDLPDPAGQLRADRGNLA